MVLPGQYLERPALVDAGDALLEGLVHRGRRRPALLVCPPLGEGGMDAPAVAELAWAAAQAGHASLRFQHRGRGASTGARDATRALDDALAAFRHLAESVGPAGAPRPAAVAVAGVASGCETAHALARACPVASLILVAPPTWPRTEGLEPLEGPLLVVLPERGGSRDVAARAAQLGSGRGRVEIIPGADPRFLAGLPLVGRAISGWLASCR
jgi:alpha/beta superfamily hydrolase